MQEELDSPETFTVKLKLMLSQVLEASGLRRSVISPVMMAWLCVCMCVYVSRCVYACVVHMSPTTQLRKKGISMPMRSSRDIPHLVTPKRARDKCSASIYI